MKKIIFALVVPVFMLSSCSSQPSCSDSEVKETVRSTLKEGAASEIGAILFFLGKNKTANIDMQEISRLTMAGDEKALKKLVNQFNKVTEEIVDMNDEELTLDNLIKWHKSNGGESESIDILNKGGDDAKALKTTLNRMISTMNNTSPYYNGLSNIRLYSEDEESGTTICLCNIGTKEYAYSAQYNEEGELYVGVEKQK